MYGLELVPKCAVLCQYYLFHLLAYSAHGTEYASRCLEMSFVVQYILAIETQDTFAA